MARHHSRACLSDNLSRLLPELGLKEVDRAVGAHGFVLAVGTFLEPHLGIVENPGAIIAKVTGFMMGRAIDADHLCHRQELTRNMFCLNTHAQAIYQILGRFGLPSIVVHRHP